MYILDIIITSWHDTHRYHSGPVSEENNSWRAGAKLAGLVCGPGAGEAPTPQGRR